MKPDTNLLELAKMLRRHLALMTAIVVVIMTAAIGLIVRMPPQYVAESTVVLNSRSNKLSDLQLISKPLLGIPSADTSVIRTEIETISSPAMIERVVEEEKLLQEPEFNPTLDRGPQGLLGRLGEISAVRHLSAGLAHLFTVAKVGLVGRPVNSSRVSAPAKPLELTMARVQHALSVTNDGVSYVLSIKFRSRDPHLAAVIANAFAMIYLREQENIKLATTRQAVAWLGRRIQELEGEVLNSEREYLSFRAQNGLLTENGATLLDQQIAQTSAQLTAASAERSKAEASLDGLKQQLRNPRALAGASVVVSSPLIQQMRLEEANLEDKVAGLSSELLPGHPRLQDARAKLRDIQAKIAAQTRLIVSGRMSQLDEAKAAETNLRARLAALRNQRAEMVGAELKLNALERVANANRSLYVSYLEKYKEISAQEHSQEPDARLLSAAAVPLYPSSPNRTMLFEAALVASLGLAVAVALLLEMTRTGVYGFESLEVFGPVRGFGLIPEVKRGGSEPVELLLSEPSSVYSESVQRAAFQCLGSMDYPRIGEQPALPRAGARVIVVTSALPGEGKSVCAASLARSIALTGKRTLLIDCDLRRPSVARLFRSRPSAELSRFIIDPNGFIDIAETDVATGLDYVALRKEHNRVHAVLNSPQLLLALDQARAKYDYVILDTPPLLPVCDALLLSKLADMVLLVVRWERTPMAAVHAVLRLLRENRIALSGVLLSRVNLRKYARHNTESSVYLKAAGYYG